MVPHDLPNRIPKSAIPRSSERYPHRSTKRNRPHALRTPETHNPSVGGSNPPRPMRFQSQIGVAEATGGSLGVNDWVNTSQPSATIGRCAGRQLSLYRARRSSRRRRCSDAPRMRGPPAKAAASRPTCSYSRSATPTVSAPPCRSASAVYSARARPGGSASQRSSSEARLR